MKFTIHKNPNPEEYAEITEAVKINEGYCPCLSVKNEDTKCMCKDFRESEESDFCHCGRFYKIGEFDTIALVGVVTDEEMSQLFSNWENMLEKQKFIVIPTKFDETNPFHMTTIHTEMSKAKIDKADAVILLDNSPNHWLIEMEAWAVALNKKIIHWSDLTK